MRTGRIGALTAVLVVALMGWVTPSAAKTYDIVIGVGHPPSQGFVFLLRDVFAAEVDKGLAKAGKGDTVRWTFGFGGTILKYGGLLEGVQEGIADLTLVPGVARPSEVPLSTITYNAPFGTESIETVYDITEECYANIPEMAEMWAKYNQIPIGFFIYDSYELMTNFPVNKLEDLKGHKIGAPGVAGNWLQGTGATAVNGNFTLYYNSIKTGVYDGFLGPLSGAYPAKMHEVAKYITLVNLGAQYVGTITMNKDKFDSFPPYLQKIVSEAGKTYSKASIDWENGIVKNGLEKMKEGGAVVTKLPEAERRKWAAAMPDLAGDWVAKMEARKLPGKTVLSAFMDGLRKRGIKPARDWDK